MNPYTPPKVDVPFACERCKAESRSLSLVGNLMCAAVSVVLGCLAAYGILTIVGQLLKKL